MLFTDVVMCDMMDPIYGYLVCSIVCNGAMKMSSSMGSISEGGKRSSEISNYRGHAEHYGDEANGRGDLPPQFRRPFGCAVLELAQLKKMATEGVEISSTKEHTMPIYVPTNETTFSMLHQDILNHNVREYEKSPRYADHLHLCWTVVDNATGPRCLRCRSRFFMGTPRLS